ncbi:hypothetical protein E2C01_033802 [Portunus trituberculatus]|uniref:Uncharacterized protein n=1 Tax=Portunus trituberculatus TaxID=210409 RepID=A0A5B7F4E7_PORTR|nr:hypothetical protein [Portunus trituberculatus]
MLWGLRGLQVHGFESCPRSECRLVFLTQGNGFLAGLSLYDGVTQNCRTRKRSEQQQLARSGRRGDIWTY